MDITVTKTNPLGTERIGKLIVTFAVPGIISMVVNALYNIVDQIFIGQGVGYLGNGATNVVMPMTVIAIALSLLIGDGAAAYLSLKLGEGDEKSAASGIGCSISVMAVVGIVLCVLFNLFLEPLCRLFGATEDILPYAVDYGRIISYGILFSSIDSGMAGMIRADGSPKYSMAGLLVGCITNIILDPIFIFGFHWGVKGAAWATIAGQILNAFLYLAYIWKFKSIKLDKQCFRISGKVMAKVSSLGISSFITQIAIVLVMAVTNNILVSYGAQSKYGAGNSPDDHRHYHESEPDRLCCPSWTGNRCAAYMGLQLRQRSEGPGKAGIPYYIDCIDNHVDPGILGVPVCPDEYCPALWFRIRTVQ